MAKVGGARPVEGASTCRMRRRTPCAALAALFHSFAPRGVSVAEMHSVVGEAGQAIVVMASHVSLQMIPSPREHVSRRLSNKRARPRRGASRLDDTCVRSQSSHSVRCLVSKKDISAISMFIVGVQCSRWTASVIAVGALPTTHIKM